MSVFQDTFTSCLCVFHHTVDLALRYLKHCDQVGIQNSWGNRHCSSIWSLHSPRHIQHDSQTRHIQHEHMHVCRFARAWVSMCVSLHVHGCPCVGRRSVRVCMWASVPVGGWVGVSRTQNTTCPGQAPSQQLLTNLQLNILLLSLTPLKLPSLIPPLGCDACHMPSTFIDY